ncbi:DUF3179 domain-containing (seleno)protein [Fibrella forsythiae]|uniref:DUF3179 domain-containing protein n=1 Tax=Fibrella forsythiae TaxID=2817061 RepID=A0ABS3JMB2_9BACT|nr:DUF3179 domain-containing (seleno)protein [Fibrella forsythiae]MBO0951138.1 DUF3179 domain-containing protein [Fibrella forsythiae]
MNTNPLRWTLVGLILLIFLEAVRVYFIMPFPGSQLDDAANLSRVGVAYWLHQYVPWLRAIILLLLITPVFNVIAAPARAWYRWLVLGLVVVYAGAFYAVTTTMMADHMFLQPTTKRMLPMSQNKIPVSKLVVGVVENGEARAYPLQLIGYHHQVRDTVGGKPIMVTYCTVCRTGRVFDPVIDGKPTTFRLVGMDHFNAMFEDDSSGSWWRQATGEAIMGPLRGKTLTELTARQMTLSEWASEHPNTLVMQPDPAFREETDSLATYDTGVRRGKLTRRDSASWKPKSWVVGVLDGQSARAIDWNELVKKKVINTVVGKEPVVITLASDRQTFRAFSRQAYGRTLTFEAIGTDQLRDNETATVWTKTGLASSGTLAGQQLTPVRAYQEFWHSWLSFHPKTAR